MTTITDAPVLASRVNSIVDQLGLTQEEVGQIVDASARSISRWSTGASAPQRNSRQRLLELAYVADAVSEVLPRRKANIWMLSPNRLLDHDSPASRVQAGRYKDVLALIEALADGVVV
jgi:transcriptional regulator with XRE-family HTH domain